MYVPADQTMELISGNTFFVGLDGSFTNSGTIYVDGTLSNSGIFLNDGQFTVSGLLTNRGTFSNEQVFLNDGTLTNSSVGTFDNNGTFTNRSLFTNGGVLTNDGVLTNSQNGTVDNSQTLTNYGLFTNDGLTVCDGTLDNISSGTVDNNSSFTVNSTFANNGLLINDGYLWISESGLLDNDGTFTNNDIVNNRGDFLADGVTRNPYGWLWRSGSGTFENNGIVYDLWDPATDGYIIPDNDRVYYIDSSITLTQDLQISGSLAIWPDGTLETSNYTVYNDGLLTLSCGDLIISVAGLLDNNLDGILTVSCGTLTNNGTILNYGAFTNLSAFVNNGIAYDLWDPATDGYIIPDNSFIYFINSSVTLTQDLVINGTLAIWTGGELNSGAYAIYNNNTLTVTGGDVRVQAIGGLFNGFASDGYVNIMTGTLTLYEFGVINNGYADQGRMTVSGGVFEQAGGTFSNGFNSPGIITMSDGIFTLTNGDFINGNNASGTLTMTNGTFNLDGAMVKNGSGATGIMLFSGGNFNLTSGTIVNGSGVGQTGNLTISGGTLTISPDSNDGDIAVGSGTSNLMVFGATITTITDGDFTIPQSELMLIPIESALHVDSFGDLNNTGTLVVAGIFIDGGAFANNGSFYDRWDFDSDGYTIPTDLVDLRQYYLDESVTLTQDFVINGTFLIWNGGILDSGCYTVSNNGTLTVSGGSLITDTCGVFYNNSILSVASGSTFDNNGLFTSSVGSTFMNDGIFTNDFVFFENGDFINNGAFTNNGQYNILWEPPFNPVPIDQYGGQYYFDSSITLTADLLIKGTLAIWSGGTLNTGCFTVTNDGGLTVSGGTLIVDACGVLFNDGVLTNHVAGTIDNYGTFTNDNIFINYGTFNNYGQFYDQGTLTNLGTITTTLPFYIQWNPEEIYTIPDDGSLYYVDFEKTLTSDLTINGTLQIWADGLITVTGPFIDVCNNGLLTILDGGFTLSGGTFYNPCCTDCVGTVSLIGGRFDLLLGSFVNSLASTSTGIVDVAGGDFNISGGILVNGYDAGSTGTVFVTSGLLTMTGGTVYNALGAQSNGLIQVDGGTFAVGDVNVINSQGTSNLTVFGAAIPGTIYVGTDYYHIYNGSYILDQNQSMVVPVGSSIDVASDGAFYIYGALTNNGTITIDGSTYLFATGTFTDNGTFNNNGTYLDISPSLATIPNGLELPIVSGADWVIPESQKLTVNGSISNWSNGSIQLYGSLYTYSWIQNGNGTGPGVININFPGLLSLLGGTLENSATSTVNIYSGGSLHNYYGIVDNDGAINLNAGGTFENSTGNDGRWHTTSGIFTIAAGSRFIDRAVITLDRDLDLDSTWTITQPVHINGCCYAINFGDNGAIVIDSGASLMLEDVTVNNISSNQIRCIDNTVTLSIKNSTFIQDGNYSFTIGAISVDGDLVLESGNETVYTFSYESSAPVAISEKSAIYVTKGIAFGLTGPITFADDTSIICLQDGTMRVSGSGLDFTVGTLKIEHDSALVVDTTYGVTLGDGTLAVNDFTIDIASGARLTIENGIVYYNNIAPGNGITFCEDSATLRVTYPDGLTAIRNLTLIDGTLSFPTTNYLATLGAAQVWYENTRQVHDNPYLVYSITGVFQSGVDYLILENGFVDIQSGQFAPPLHIASGSSTVRGVGVVAGDITLEDSTSNLTLALDSGLNGNVTLNSGTITLETHLTFVGDNIVTGPGTIVVGTNKFSFGTTTLSATSDLFWDTESQIMLDSKVSLEGAWTFSGNGQLHGNGNVLDLTNGGQLVLASGAVLDLTDIILKGLGDSNGKIVFADDGARINMSNVSVILSSDYTVTIGSMYVEGPTTWFVDDHEWTFDQSSSLTVDGTVLWLDRLDQSSQGNLLFGSPESSYLHLINSGTIRYFLPEVTDTLLNCTVRLDAIEADLALLFSYLSTIDHGPYNYSFDSNQTLSYNIYLGPQHRMYLQEDLILNGSTWYIHFSRADEPLLFIDPGKTVTLQDIVLKDFLPEYVSFGDENSQLVFGSGTTLELADDVTLLQRWLFSGNATIKGFGNTISLSTGSMLDVFGSTELTLDRVKFCGLSSDKIRCRTNDGSIVFDDVELGLASDYTFSYGSILIKNDVEISGTNSFIYSSVRTSTIDSCSQLRIDHGTTLSYAPQTSNRDLLFMTDATSRLYLDGCMLYSTPTGIRLNNGRVFIDNYVTLSADGQVLSEAIEFGDSLMVDVLSGAYVEAYGYIDMN